MGNSIVLDQNSTVEEYANVLRGRYVTSVTVVDGDDCAPLEAIFTLDNGITLVAHGNEGCEVCGNDWYYIEKAFACGSAQARIMGAYARHSQDMEDLGHETYTIFVMVNGNYGPTPSKFRGRRRRLLRDRVHPNRISHHKRKVRTTCAITNHTDRKDSGLYHY